MLSSIVCLATGRRKLIRRCSQKLPAHTRSKLPKAEIQPFSIHILLVCLSHNSRLAPAHKLVENGWMIRPGQP